MHPTDPPRSPLLLSPSPLSPSPSPFVLSLSPFLLSLDCFFFFLFPKLSSSSSSFVELYVQDLFTFYEVRVYLSEVLDESKLNESVFLETWGVFSTYFQKIVAPIVAHFPMYSLQNRPISVVLSDHFFFRDIFRDNISILSNLISSHAIFTEQIARTLFPHQSPLPNSPLFSSFSSHVSTAYWKLYGKYTPSVFRSFLLYSLNGRLVTLSKCLFSYLDAGRRFCDSLPLILRFCSPDSLSPENGFRAAMIEGIGTIWSLNSDLEFVTFLRLIETNFHVTQERGQWDTIRLLMANESTHSAKSVTTFSLKIDILQSISKFCDVYEDELACSLSSDPSPTHFASHSHPPSASNPLLSSPASFFFSPHDPPSGAQSFGYKPELVRILEDVSSLRVQFSVTSMLFFSVTSHFSQFGKWFRASPFAASFPPLSSLSLLVESVLKWGGSMRGSRPPADFVPFLLLLWEVQHEKESGALGPQTICDEFFRHSEKDRSDNVPIGPPSCQSPKKSDRRLRGILEELEYSFWTRLWSFSLPSLMHWARAVFFFKWLFRVYLLFGNRAYYQTIHLRPTVPHPPPPRRLPPPTPRRPALPLTSIPSPPSLSLDADRAYYTVPRHPRLPFLCLKREVRWEMTTLPLKWCPKECPN